MIKKLAITGLACVCSLCISAEAFAYSTRSKIYFGADYVYSDIKYKNNTLYEMDDGYNGISPVIGFSSYGVGLEAWYMFSDKAENKHGYESELTAYGADLVGEAPLSESFSVIVSIGLAKYTFKITQPNGWKYDQDVNGPRFGIGLQYEIIPHIAFACLQANEHSPVVRKQFTGLFSFLQPTPIQDHLVKVAFLFLYLHFLPYNKHGKTKQQINYLLFKILFFNGKRNRAAGKKLPLF